MEATVWVGDAGLLATVTASAIGFYFAQKSQRSPLRQELYKKQVEYLTDFVVVATQMQLLAAAYSTGSMTFGEGSEAEQVWEGIADQLRDITQRSGLVLPSAAYSTMTAYRAAQNDFEDALINKADLEVPLRSLAGALAHVFMVGREILGADNLSSESIRLHSAKGYDDMNRIGSKALGKVYQALWHRGQGPTVKPNPTFQRPPTRPLNFDVRQPKIYLSAGLDSCSLQATLRRCESSRPSSTETGSAR